MIITGNSPEVAVLKQVWNSAEGRDEDLMEDLRRRLMLQVLVPAMEGFSGHLILKYHEFLTRVSNGNHSFARGSEMETKTVYWVSVGRLSGCDIEEVPEVVHRVQGENKFVTPKKVRLPVHWETFLMPQYQSGEYQAYFVLGEPNDMEENKFDISLLGYHLFSLMKPRFDWATKIEIAVGNESVGTWLTERKSAQTFNMLMRR